MTIPATRLTISSVEHHELELFSSVLQRVARQLVAEGQPLWPPESLTLERLLGRYRPEEMYLGERSGEVVAAMVLQEADPLFWPDVVPGESLFVHKLVVDRRLKGQGLGAAMLDWAAERGRALGRTHLRLDTAAERPQLHAVYEGYGFQRVGRRRVDGFDCLLYELRL